MPCEGAEALLGRTLCVRALKSEPERKTFTSTQTRKAQLTPVPHSPTGALGPLCRAVRSGVQENTQRRRGTFAGDGLWPLPAH